MKSARKIKNVYHFDTSAFVTLSRTSENVIKMPKALWDHLAKMMKTGDIISHQLVFEEICSNQKKPDFITNWIKNKSGCFLPKTDVQRAQIPAIVAKHPELINFEMEREQADPWLIALAIEKSKENTLFNIWVSIVVSQENPRSSKKIPAACSSFGVKHLSLRGFFDEIGFSTGLTRK